MSKNRDPESPLGQDTSIEKLQKKTVAGLKAANGRPDSLGEVILSYLREGYGLGLSPSELTDYFAVSTPNIIEEACYAGTDGDSVAALFDKLHDEFRRKGGLGK